MRGEWPIWRKIGLVSILMAGVCFGILAIKVAKLRREYQSSIVSRSAEQDAQIRLAMLEKKSRVKNRHEIDLPVDLNVEQFLSEIAALRSKEIPFKIQPVKHSRDPVVGGYTYPVPSSTMGLWESDWILMGTMAPSTLMAALPVIQTELKKHGGVVTELETRDLMRIGKLQSMAHMGKPGDLPVKIRMSIFGKSRTSKTSLEEWLSVQHVVDKSIFGSLANNAARNLGTAIQQGGRGR